MTLFKYKTRGNSTPQGKPRIYFCSHPEDAALFFDDISKDILEKQNCAIWYRDSLSDVCNEETLSLLSQMQLFVIPITLKFLTTSNRALDVEFPYAVQNHIPVLPIMQEAGLEELFNQKCGNLQFLDKLAQDITAISYSEKLDKFLSNILIGDSLAAQIRAAFDDNAKCLSDLLQNIPDPAVTIQDGLLAKDYLDNKKESLSEEERILLEKRIQAGMEAETLLYDLKMHMISSIVSGYSSSGVPFSELLHIGRQALISGARKYGRSTGNDFVHYVSYYIRQKIVQAIATKEREFHISVQEIDGIEKLKEELGHLDTKHLLLQEEQARQLLTSQLSKLSSREAAILRLLYGLEGENVHSLQEVAHILSLSENRIRQIENKALRKLNVSFHKNMKRTGI